MCYALSTPLEFMVQKHLLKGSWGLKQGLMQLWLVLKSYVAKAGHELLIHLLLGSECWNYRYMPANLEVVYFVLVRQGLSTELGQALSS